MLSSSWSWIIFCINCCVYSSHGSMDGFSSICDLFTEEDNSIWHKNSGYQIQSWVQSVLPYPSENHETRVWFNTDNKYISLFNLTSSTGLAWRAFGKKRHDGWLYGPTDSNGNYLPGKTLYLFPDFKTGLIGTFENNDKLTKGVPTTITHYRCFDRVMQLKFRKPKKQSTVYKDYLPTESAISLTPKIRDPLDNRNVYISPSIAFPEIANEDSLYAKRDIPPHSLVSYYVGYYVDVNNLPSNFSTYEFMKNLIDFNGTTYMNMPPESSEINNYYATLGHKINHDFDNNNIIFGYGRHPVYGETRILESIRHIKKGDELFVNYNYDIASASTPKWYIDLFEKRKLSNSEIGQS